MKIRNIILLSEFCLLIVSTGLVAEERSLPESPNSGSLLLRKGTYIKGESAYFNESIILPKENGEYSDPLNFENAAFQLQNGLDQEILQIATRVYDDICRNRINCQINSTKFWDNFDQVSRLYYVEENYTLNDYMVSLSEGLGLAWHLIQPCDSGVSLCNYLANRLYSSPEMFGRMIFRKALLNELKVPSSMCEIAGSMGDMVEQKVQLKYEC